MSFLYDSILPGSSSLHVGGGARGKQGKVPRKAQSHAGLLTSLVRLVRDPVGAISGAVGTIRDAPSSSCSDGDIDRRQLLYVRMRNAETYDEWKCAATELDTLEGNDAWKAEDDSFEYDALLVAARLRQLDEARLSCNVNRMLFLIRTALTRGLGGMGDLRLYKHSHIGTKVLIERYIDSAQKTLNALLEVSATQGPSCPIETCVLMEQLLLARQSFGRSALLLSGGGTFGMNHIGVVKTLWQTRLLPRIISGASAGSIVSAVVCTKTDAEIPIVLDEFCYGDLAVFEKEGEEDTILRKAARFLKYGALFDISHLQNVMRSMLGDITFQEAYNRTRRILNITVSSASLYELPRLLNYVTAPNVMIWSAVCASCSVPLIFSTASLLAKDPRTGKEVPWNPTPNAGWIDGSVDNDLPMTRLAEMFNVNHFIVSQVNPHVVPFLAKEEELIGVEAQNAAFSAGPKWIHNMANLAKGEALHRLHVLAEMGIFPNYVSKVRSILNQRYSGDITIFPSISYAHFPKVLSNPTTEYMLQSMLTGERATWPKLSQIQNHVAIELALDGTIQQLRARVVFSSSQIDLRLNNVTRPLSQGNDNVRGNRVSKPIVKTTRFKRVTAPPTPSLATAPLILSRDNHLPIKLASTQMAKPHLPTYPVKKYTKPLGYRPTKPAHYAFSSSTNPEDGSTTDDEDREFSPDSDTSDLLSSPEPPSSPTSTLPTLWPSTRQLFPSASQPNTPSISSSLFGHRRASLLNLTMTSGIDARVAAPSSPELHYKRLFHPAPHAPPDETEIFHAQLPSEGEKAVQPMVQALPDVHSRYLHSPAVFFPSLTPTLSPLTSREHSRDPSQHAMQRRPNWSEKRDPKDTESEVTHSRRSSVQGAGLGLLLDISGTRGMMLRRKKSFHGGSARD